MPKKAKKAKKKQYFTQDTENAIIPHLVANPFSSSIITPSFFKKDLKLLDGRRKGCIAPRKAVVGDFNADNIPDLFVACTGYISAACRTIPYFY